MPEALPRWLPWLAHNNASNAQVSSKTADLRPPSLRFVAEEPPKSMASLPAVAMFAARADGELPTTARVQLVPSNVQVSSKAV
jgi:hypothetical protein